MDEATTAGREGAGPYRLVTADPHRVVWEVRRRAEGGGYGDVAIFGGGLAEVNRRHAEQYAAWMNARAAGTAAAGGPGRGPAGPATSAS